MFTFEDMIDDTIEELYPHIKDDLSDVEKYFLLEQVKKFGYLVAKFLRKNKSLKYSYFEKLILCRNMMHIIFVIGYCLLSYKVEYNYSNIFLKETFKKFIDLIKTNDVIEVENENFLLYSKFCVYKMFNKFIDSYENNQKNKIKKFLDKCINYILINKYRIFYYVIHKNYFNLYKSNKLSDLHIEFGKDIIKMEKSIENIQFYLYYKILNIRNNCYKNFGYYVHLVRFSDNSNLPDNEYQILIRGKEVSKGIFQYDNMQSIDKMFNHLEKVVIEYVHEIFSVSDTYKYFEYVKQEHSKKIVRDLLKQLDINDIKTIFCNLIQKEISIRDLPYVVENLANFARFDKDTNGLTEKMIQVLSGNV